MTPLVRLVDAPDVNHPHAAAMRRGDKDPLARMNDEVHDVHRGQIAAKDAGDSMSGRPGLTTGCKYYAV